MTVTTVFETKTKSTLNAAVRTSDVITSISHCWIFIWSFRVCAFFFSLASYTFLPSIHFCILVIPLHSTWSQTFMPCSFYSIPSLLLSSLFMHFIITNYLLKIKIKKREEWIRILNIDWIKQNGWLLRSKKCAHTQTKEICFCWQLKGCKRKKFACRLWIYAESLWHEVCMYVCDTVSVFRSVEKGRTCWFFKTKWIELNASLTRLYICAQYVCARLWLETMRERVQYSMGNTNNWS